MAHLTELPTIDLSAKEHKEIVEAYDKLRQAEAKLVSLDGKMEILPNNVYSFLLRLVADLRAGAPVTILQSKHELTTMEAAKILGMSRQYLVQLLEKGELAFHMTGTHRRIYARDVLAYKAKRDADRRKTLSEMARQGFEEGDYGRVPDDFHAGK